MWAMYNREVPAEIKGPGTTLPPLHHLATTSSSVQQKYKYKGSKNKNTNTQKVKTKIMTQKVTRKTKKMNTNESIGLGPATFPHLYFSSYFYIKICDKIMSFKICLVKRTNKITPIIRNLQGKSSL